MVLRDLVYLRVKLPFCIKRYAFILPGYYAGLGNNRGFWSGLRDLLRKNIPHKAGFVNNLFNAVADLLI